MAKLLQSAMRKDTTRFLVHKFNMAKIKICGITRFEDAQLAASLGAWAVGFIFVKESARYISAQNVFEITSKLPEKIEKIGVFVNSTLESVVQCAKIANLSMVQLHGEESAQYCLELKNKLDLPIIKAFRVKSKDDIEQIEQYKDIVSFILLDSYSEKEHGGTGMVFDWNLALQAKGLDIPLILAGGISPKNINEALEQVSPFAVDISSGVEKEKGIKDHELLKQLFS